jgi:hypothetical protein
MKAGKRIELPRPKAHSLAGMKRNPTTALLMAALFVLAAATALLSYQYVRTVGRVQRLTYQRMMVSRQVNLFESLLKETLEYGKTNPAIDPIFQSIGLKVNRSPAPRPTAPAAPAKTTNKP